jgi:hypothetical protein
MMKAVIAAAFLVMGLSPVSVMAQTKTVNQAIDETLGDHAAYERVILATRKAVAAHDAAGLAPLVRYPIKVTIGGKKRIVSSPAAFIAHYDAIVTPAIAKAVTQEKYEDLMVNYRGVMLGQGEMWINGLCLDNGCKNVDVKIVTIQPRSPLSPPLK